MRISVIAPVLNSKPYLPGFLAALAAQDYQADYEIIAVDNGSTDGSLEILQQHDRVTALSEPTRGAYSARNRGIRAARGQILAFIDPDCIPAPNWLRAIDRALETPERQIVLGKREYDAPSRALRRLSEYDAIVAEYVFSSEAPDTYYGYTNNMAVRRSLFDRFGLFHEIRRGADTVFVRRTADTLGSRSVCYAPDMAVCHLEIRHTGDFYRKRVIYGMSNQRSKALGSSRPLRMNERMRVFTKTVRDLGYSPLGAAELFALLGAGVLCYEFGRWCGRWTTGPGSDGSAADGSAAS